MPSPAVIAGESVLVATSNGRLAAIDLGSGLLVWQSEQGDGLLRSLALAPQVVGVRGGAEPGLVGFAHDPMARWCRSSRPPRSTFRSCSLPSSPRPFLWCCSRSWPGAGCALGWGRPSWTTRTTCRSSPARISKGSTGMTNKRGRRRGPPPRPWVSRSRSPPRPRSGGSSIRCSRQGPRGRPRCRACGRRSPAGWSRSWALRCW